MLNNLFITKVLLKGMDNYNCYPYNIPLITNFKELNFNKPVTFIVGENGSGKSTFLEALAISVGLNPEGGSKNMVFNTYETHSSLHQNMVVYKGIRKPSTKYFFRAESFYNVATETEKNSDALYYGMNGVSLHNSSHGESFINLIKNRFYPNGLYLMDEPEAALSPTNQMKMLVLINDLVKNGAQFIICTHSPIILAYPNAEIYQINNGELILTEYKNTDLFSLYKRFVLDYDRVIKDLID